MAAILMNARLRQSYITQLGEQYTKMRPMEDELIQVGGQEPEDMAVIRKSLTSRLNENKRSALAQGNVNNINSQQKKMKVAWRFHLRRLRVKVNRLRKRLGGSVMRGVQGSRALAFHGATSTAANLIYNYLHRDMLALIKAGRFQEYLTIFGIVHCNYYYQEHEKWGVEEGFQVGMIIREPTLARDDVESCDIRSINSALSSFEVSSIHCFQEGLGNVYVCISGVHLPSFKFLIGDFGDV